MDGAGGLRLPAGSTRFPRRRFVSRDDLLRGAWENWFGGVYREIEPNRRLVFTFAWDEGPSARNKTLVTISFTERNGKTEQVFHQTPFLNVERRDSHLGGWTSAFDCIEAYVAELSRKGT